MIAYDYDANEITLSPADFVRLYAAPKKEQPKRPERLTRALMRCHLAALAYAQEDDGGTCNFDAPMLDYRASGIPLGEAKQAIADAGLRCYEHRMYGEKALVICGCQHGQGNRRTVMAEAFSRALKAQGYVCGMNNNAQKIIESAKSQLGNPYVFGMWGRECTPSVRRQYAGYNPSHKSAIYKACPVLSGKQPSCDGCKWQGKLAFDCRGFIYWCIFQGYGFKLKGGGCTSQWGYKVNWAQQGEIGDMPDLVCCVYQYRGGKFQHTGIHIGGGKVIHCSAGVQWGDTSDKAWTHYAIPAGLYTAAEITAAKPLGDHTPAKQPEETVYFNLRRGSKGTEVTRLQAALNALGYACGAADGIFGAKTEAAVRNFQRDHSLTVDGIAGKATQEALYAAESVPRATYTVTLRNVPQADAIALTAKYAGEMVQTEERTA